MKNALLLETDRPAVLRQVIQAVRKGGTLSIPGVYGGMLDKVPFGAAFGKGITMKMGQTNMHNYMKPLLERIEKGQIDPSYIISHRISLDKHQIGLLKLPLTHGWNAKQLKRELLSSVFAKFTKVQVWSLRD